MITARDVYSCLKTVTTAALVVAAIVAALVFPRNAWAAAGNTQTCTVGATCTVGEFLYDDSYNPLTTATCLITSRYPDGSLLHNQLAMTSASQGDGWYYYTFSAPSTTGLYRTEVKCTTLDSQVLKLDKSFEVAAVASTLSADDISAAVWGYSDRTLSSFGSLVSSIWENGTRTLTGAGLSSGSIATKADVDGVSTKVDSIASQVDDVESSVESITTTVVNNTSTTTEAVEKFINAPIIQTTIADDGLTSYQTNTKISQTVTVVNRLSKNTEYLKSKTKLIDSKWSSLKSEKILSSVKSLKAVLGTRSDKGSKNSIFGNVNYITDKWGWIEADKVVLQTKSISVSLDTISKSIEKSGKSSATRAELKKLLTQLDSLYLLVGNNKSISKKDLFSKINETNKYAKALDLKYSDVRRVLITWETGNKNLKNKIGSLTDDILALNRLPKADQALLPAKKESADRTLKNKALGLMGIIDANRKLLAQRSNSAFSTTWLELGSIVFKSIITNPSSSISQTVPFKYDLPSEIKKEDVLDLDESLELHFDQEKNSYYISGTFKLSPNESKTVSVSVDEKAFEISISEVNSMRKQAEELSKPLSGTSYFAQGVTLKSDIDVSLDKAEALKDEASTPEEKIRSYRDARIELNAAKVKMEKLKEIVTTAGSVGTFFGFVGGAQTLAVWGMIIIMVAGFVFLTLYMRTLRLQDTQGRAQAASMGLDEGLGEVKKKGKGKGKGEVEEVKKPLLDLDDPKPKKRFSRNIKVGIMILGVFGISSLAFSGFNAMRGSSESHENKPKVVAAVKTEKKVLAAKSEPLKSVSVNIIVPEDNLVSIHEEPSLSSAAVATLEEGQLATKIEEEDGWTKVSFKKGKNEITGWVDSDFTEDIAADSKEDDNVVKKPSSVEEEVSTVMVAEDLTGFLRVRETAPDGAVVRKISAGEKFNFVSEAEGWTEIELENGKTGWVSSEYVIVK